MQTKVSDLAQIQQLVLDIRSIERNHNIPGSDAHENVVEHCFSVAMLCWKLYVSLKPNLNFERVLKYCLAHDFLERGLKKDINTYADAATRAQKKEREQLESRKLEQEFNTFSEMLDAIRDYENMADEEARFVWTVDKMQAIVLGEIDGWRPYKRVNVTYQQFYDKGEDFLTRCPNFLKETLIELNNHSRKTFYDQPAA